MLSGCNGLSGCCTENNKCGVMEGDCNSDSQCLEGLKCGTGNCIVTHGSSYDSGDNCCYNSTGMCNMLSSGGKGNNLVEQINDISVYHLYRYIFNFISYNCLCDGKKLK